MGPMEMLNAGNNLYITVCLTDKLDSNDNLINVNNF